MYRDFYRLSDEPFRVTPDPDFLFLADQYKEALAAIVYGIAKRKGFVCITGEVGVGKTTILRSYLSSVENNGVTFVYIFNPKVSFAVLMLTILRDLHLPTDG
ncbi:MAG TPA: AAA family ATPase, partial [Patescibacteria group bacterium]|nr:AAA family ATPase [Patescibacteria group bacterium]